MASLEINGHCAVTISDASGQDEHPKLDPNTGKPYLLLTIHDEFGAQHLVALTTNLAEMIGGIAKGTRERYESKKW